MASRAVSPGAHADMHAVYGWQISQDTPGFYKLYSQKRYNSLNGYRLPFKSFILLHFYCINISISVVFYHCPLISMVYYSQAIRFSTLK